MTPSLTAPLRLRQAAALAFPHGGMTASGLRKEAARGRLDIWRIAGKDYTSLAAIDRMLEQCRTAPKAPDSGFAPRAPASAPSGSSATADVKLARDAALATAQRLIDGSRPTSPKNIARLPSARVIRPKFGSPTC